MECPVSKKSCVDLEAAVKDDNVRVPIPLLI